MRPGRRFREFYADCFWYCRKDLVIGPGDVEWVAETLRKNGDMRAWRVAGRLSPGKNLPGFVRAPVATGDQATHINWARDPAWRFMPLMADDTGGPVLRRGRYQPEDVARLVPASPLDLAEAKTAWRAALLAADEFVRSRPHHEAGCVYHSPARNSFVAPSPERSLKEQGLVTHFGQSGGILPRVADV